jgi:hypothetical protein
MREEAIPSRPSPERLGAFAHALDLQAEPERTCAVQDHDFPLPLANASISVDRDKSRSRPTIHDS